MLDFQIKCKSFNAWLEHNRDNHKYVIDKNNNTYFLWESDKNIYQGDLLSCMLFANNYHRSMYGE